MTQEVLELKAYVDRLELLITVCIVLFFLGLIGLALLFFGTKEDDDQ